MISKFALKAVCTAAVVAGAALVAPAAHAGTSSQTKYPIVLVHGFIGFDNILGAVNYFYDIPGNLRKEGATVYVASVNPSQTTEFRGEELIQQMKQWAAKDGVKKFNLIGHSHGGPTVRYAAGTVPTMVASITTMAATHFGSKVADELAPTFSEGSTLDSLATSGLKLISWLTGNKTTDKTSLQAALASLSTEGSAAFNAKFPGPASYFGTEENDGLVGRCSSHWGKVLKDNYAWNHLDEINQVLGTIGKNAPSPVAFYQQQANRLKLAGM